MGYRGLRTRSLTRARATCIYDWLYFSVQVNAIPSAAKALLVGFLTKTLFY